MAKKGSVGEYICGHCGSSDMQPIKFEDRGKGVERIHLRCNKCGGSDYYDSCEGGK